MKRPAGDDELDIDKKKKRVKHVIFDDPTLQRRASDISNDSFDKSGVGYIACTISMSWRPTTKIRFNVVTEEVDSANTNVKYGFDVELSGRCLDFFHKPLAVHDSILLSLKGAHVVKKLGGTSSPRSLPFTLKFLDGVALKFIKRPKKPEENGLVIDTWELGRAAQRSEDNPGLQTTSSMNVDPGVLRDAVGNSKSVTTSNNNPPPGLQLPQKQAASAPVSVAVSGPAPGQKLSKTQRRNLRKLKKKEAASAQAHIETPPRPPPTFSNTNALPEPTNSVDSLQTSNDIAANPHASASASTRISASTSTSASTAISASTASISYIHAPNNNVSGPSTGTMSPFSLPFPIPSGYKLLKDYNGRFPNNIIGIVFDTTTPRQSGSKDQDWMCSIDLVDPSVYPKWFKVNFFAEHSEDQLPACKVGDVLVVRNVKGGRSSQEGVVYKDKLCFAVFDPSSSTFKPSSLIGSSVPDLGESQRTYCTRIVEWWKEKETGTNAPKNEQDGIVHRISPKSAGQVRQHRLICESGPTMPPNGFFDCTVEVLYGYQNHNNIYSLYVTDYTQNPAGNVTQASWCPPNLGNKVLKIEMWDDAAELGLKMQAGEYWTMKNVRIKVSNGGVQEGTISETKMQKLDEAKADWEPALKALLDRKQALGEDPSDQGQIHQLISEFSLDVLFRSCTVEVLHTVYDPNGRCFLYVTDYSSHPDLISVGRGQPWAQNLEGRVLKIALWEKQTRLAESIAPGTCALIRSLRFSKTWEGLEGRLSGDGKLFYEKTPGTKDDEHMIQFLKRKEIWKQEITNVHDVQADQKQSPAVNPAKTPSSKISSTPASAASTSSRSVGRRDYLTIKDVVATQKLPNRLTVKARVTSFYPLQLNEVVVRHCVNCGEDLEPMRLACFWCGDSDHDFVCFKYRLCLWLEDEEGTSLQVPLTDPDCPLLKGLELADFRDNRPAFESFLKRIAPMIGNLQAVHDGILKDKTIEVVTPTISFVIDVWEALGGRRAYALHDIIL